MSLRRTIIDMIIKIYIKITKKIYRSKGEMCKKDIHKIKDKNRA